MIPTRLFQVIGKIVPFEKTESTLHAFKQDPLIWNDLSSPETLEQMSQEWPGSNYSLTPASLALFKIDHSLLQNETTEIQPSAPVLETALLAYEDYLQNKTSVDNLQLAANLALALYMKAQQNTDWLRLLRETTARQGLETALAWMEFWGTPLSILNGWIEDRLSFLQALLQVKQPEFGLEMLRHVILTLPADIEEQSRLFKNSLALAPLSAQVSAVQQLHLAGDETLAKEVAAGLLERHLIKDVEIKSTSEIWQTSEKSLLAGNTSRQLAALAQYAGDYKNAETFLKVATQNYAVELAGTLIQSSALKVAQGISPAAEIEQIPAQLSSDENVQNEIAMLGDKDSFNSAETNAPLATFLSAKAVLQAGNESLAKQMARESVQALNLFPFESARALNWNPRQLLDQLIEFELWLEARRVVDRLIILSPTDLELLLRSVKIAEATADRGHLIESLENITLFEPQNSELMRQLANAYQEAGDWSNAFGGYDTLIQNLGSTEISDYLGYAESALKTGKAPLAIEFAQKILTTSPENGQALAILGYAHHKQGQTEKALEFLNRSVSLAPDSIEPWLLMAELYKEKGEMAKAVEVLRTARNTFPGEKKVGLELAKELLAQGQAAESLTALKEIQSDSPDLESALLMIQVQKALSLPDSAELIENTHVSFPASSEAAYEYADLQLRCGDRGEAARLLEPLLKGDSVPTDWKLAYADALLGEDYRNVHQSALPATEQLRTAKAILSETLLAEPENIYAKVLSAELAIKEGQESKAFEFLTNLLKETSTENSNWFDRVRAGFAWAATLLHKFDLALGPIQSIVDAHPEWAGASQTLAQVDQATGEITDAVDQANQVLAIAPDVVQSAEWFANFMSDMGKKNEAEKTIQNLAKTHADKLPLLVKLAEMKLQGNDLHETKGIAENIKRFLPKAKRDDEIVRAAKVFDQLGDEPAALEALKLRLANQAIAPELALTDLASYQRAHEKLADALKVISDAEQKLGQQRWLELIKAETLHAAGNTAEAYSLLKTLPVSNEHRPAEKGLSFLPHDWQSMFDENPSVDALEQDLAFESGNYEQVYSQPGDSSADVTGEVIKIEAGYALGNGRESLPWIECTPDDARIYTDPFLAAQVSEILLDAGQIQPAGEVLVQALEHYPQDKVLKISASRQAVLNGDWLTAEALFAQELPGFSKEVKIVTAKTVCSIRNLVKAAAALDRWPEAELWSKRLLEQQPANQAIQLNRLQVLVKSIEFSTQNQGLEIKQHILPDAQVDAARKELVSLMTTSEAEKNPEFEHWIARGKVALDPAQANIRRLAMITPAPDDIAAMMMALDHSAQKLTALQLGKKHENESLVLYALANCLKEKEPQKAREALEKIWKMKAVLPVTYALGAQLNQKQGEHYSAINEIEEALEYWPDEAGWHEIAAENWNAVGDLQNCTGHLEKALQLEPENSVVQLKLGQTLLQSKETEKAIECLQAVSKKDVNRYEAWESLSEAYYQAGQTDQALEAAQRATTINAFSVKPYLLSAKINLDQKKADKALELAQKAVQQDANNAEALIVLAKAWLASGNKLQALHALEKVPQAKNVDVSLLIEHARLIKEINGPANAKGMLESLAERYPDNLDVLNMLAEAQLANGDKVNAEKSAQQSLKLQEGQPQMQRFLGKLEFESGHLDQAIFHYSQAIALVPQASEPYLELSKVYEQQRDYTSAINTLNTVLDMQPKDLQALLAAANLMRSAKDYGKAESLLRRAAEISPNDLNVRRQLGAVIALNLVESSQEASSHI